jgi:5-(carboxyamino)imidazole ribonucleotide synthase
MKRVGILGGGQLGTMLAGAVHDLGAHVAIYEPEPMAPACTYFKDVTNAAWTDAKALQAFIARCDVVTYELEHIETSALRALAPSTLIFPSLDVLEATQDRAKEKEFLRASGLPFVDFAVVRGGEELLRAAPGFGLPFILKTARGGYDGKGQALVKTREQLAAIAARLSPGQMCVLEEVIDLALEASCIVGRSKAGEEVVFPVFENAHSAHILDLTLVPARVSAELAQTLQKVALDAARALSVTGLLTTEFFVTKAGSRSRGIRSGDLEVFVNELAPRPHNSGHVTRSACQISQFEVLARILLDVPLPAPMLVGDGYWCMGNLLGDVWLAQKGARGEPVTGELDLGALAQMPEVRSVVLYGKRDPQSRRKMGHFVTHGDDAESAMRAAKAFREALESGIISTPRR